MTGGLKKRILSIQSHVVHGYVGNRAATFPLQFLGWDVDALNTVQFSNHPAYGKFKGTKLLKNDLNEIYKGLIEINTGYDAVLTGYTPSAEMLESIGEICNDISVRNKNVTWVLDPVLGDNGKLYVSKETIPIYHKLMETKKVSIITPNQFEAEILTGIKIMSTESLKKVIEIFHKKFEIKNVVITSLNSDSNFILSGLSNENENGNDYCNGGLNNRSIKNKLITIASQCDESLNPRIFLYALPAIDATFSGSGDFFSAILTDRFYTHLHINDESLYNTNINGKSLLDLSLPLVKAVGEALTITHNVLEITYESEKQEYFNNNKEIPNIMKINDIRIIHPSVMDNLRNPGNSSFSPISIDRL